MKNVIAVLSALLIGCGGGSDSDSDSSDDDAGTAGAAGNTSGLDGGTAGSDAGTPPEGDEQTPACAKYIECVARVSPATLAPILESYGPAGACWGQGADLAATCNDACRKGLEDANKLDPSEAACGCTTDAECEPNQCLLETHRCVPPGDPAMPMVVACLAALAEELGTPEVADHVRCVQAQCPDAFEALYGSGGICEGIDTCAQQCPDSTCSVSCTMQEPACAMLADCFDRAKLELFCDACPESS